MVCQQWLFIWPLWTLSKMMSTYWCSTGSSNGLVPLDNKPSPKPALIQIAPPDYASPYGITRSGVSAITGGDNGHQRWLFIWPLWTFSKMMSTYWCSTGSSNGLVPLGNKPPPKPELIQTMHYQMASIDHELGSLNILRSRRMFVNNQSQGRECL